MLAAACCGPLLPLPLVDAAAGVPGRLPLKSGPGSDPTAGSAAAAASASDAEVPAMQPHAASPVTSCSPQLRRRGAASSAVAAWRAGSCPRSSAPIVCTAPLRGSRQAATSSASSDPEEKAGGRCSSICRRRSASRCRRCARDWALAASSSCSCSMARWRAVRRQGSQPVLNRPGRHLAVWVAEDAPRREGPAGCVKTPPRAGRES